MTQPIPPMKDSDRDWWVDEEDWADEAYYRGLADYFQERYDELDRLHGPFEVKGECND